MVKSADRRVSSLKPVAQKACKLFLQECEKAGVHIYLTETYRSSDRQRWLYAQGRTRFPGPVVTWTLNSNHMTGMAWDIAVSAPKNMYDSATLAKAGAIARRLGIEWGGDWTKTPDRPHFQVGTSWKGSSLDPDPYIVELQRLLNQVGFKLALDGLKGNATDNAIVIFQRRAGLVTDGEGGPLTIAKLKETIAKNNPKPKPRPKPTPKPTPPKEEIRMYRPSTQTFKNEMNEMLNEAHAQGILNNNEWYELSKSGKLSLDDAVGLQAAIIRRTLLKGGGK